MAERVSQLKPSNKQISSKKLIKKGEAVKSQNNCLYSNGRLQQLSNQQVKHQLKLHQQQLQLETPSSLQKQNNTPLKQNKLIWTSEEQFLLMMIRINPQKLSCQLEIPDTSQIEKRCFRMRTSKFQKTLIKIEKFNILASKYLQFIHKGYKKDHEEFSAVRQSIKKLVDDLWDLMKNSRCKIGFDKHQFNQKLRPEKESNLCRKKHCPYRLLYTLYWQFKLLHAIHNFDYECVFEKIVIWPEQARKMNDGLGDSGQILTQKSSQIGIEVSELQRIILNTQNDLQWPNDLIPKKQDSFQVLERKKQLSILFVYFTGRYHILLTATNQVMQVWQQRLKSFYAKDQASQWYRQHIMRKQDSIAYNYGNFQEDPVVESFQKRLGEIRVDSNSKPIMNSQVDPTNDEVSNKCFKRDIKRDFKRMDKVRKEQTKVKKQFQKLHKIKQFKAMTESQFQQQDQDQDNTQQVEYKIFKKNSQDQYKIEAPSIKIYGLPHRQEQVQILPTVQTPRFDQVSPMLMKQESNIKFMPQSQLLLKKVQGNQNKEGDQQANKYRAKPLISVNEFKYRNSVRFKQPVIPTENSLKAFEELEMETNNVAQNASSSEYSDDDLDNDDFDRNISSRLSKRNTCPTKLGILYLPRLTSSGSKIRHNSILSENLSVQSKTNKNDIFKKSHFQKLQK